MMERFERHLQLEGFGQEAQERLQNAKVLVIGAGGLGCPVLMQLAAMGVGHLAVIDPDRVERTNLHRQLLYGQPDVGQLKVEVAQRRLQEAYPDLQFETRTELLTTQNAADWVAGYDLIVDATDSIPTRYLINDACVLLQKPLIYGALFQYEGQVSVFNWYERGKHSANYRDLFPQPPKNGKVPTCNDNGVLGILPQLIGGFMATEAVKVLTGFASPLANRLLTYDLRNHASYTVEFTPRGITNDFPADLESLAHYDYVGYCNLPESAEKSALVMEVEEAVSFMQKEKNTLLIDLRLPHESPHLGEIPHIRVAWPELKEQPYVLQAADNLLFVCKSGGRSQQAAKWAQSEWPGKKIIDLAQGASTLKEAFERH